MAVNEDNVTKYKSGTKSCSLLVTSSVRLDKNSITTNIVEIEANTINLTPSENSYVYLDEDLIQKAKTLLNNKSASCINGHNRLYQLRQVRSKFHCLSTYTMCRSFGSIASNLMFQAIAYAVIENGTNARVGIHVFKHVQASLNDNKGKQDVVDILKLEGNGSIAIIDNVVLSTKLQALAESMVVSIKNASDVAKQLLLEYCRR